jgi:hypothetical protein
MTKEGKAYGFFHCDASKEAIESELPAIRKLVKTPSKLELSLTEGMDNLKGDSKLKALAQEAKQDGINYVLEATYSNASNKQAADEVAGIINQAYQLPLYKKGEQFKGGIAYEDKGNYVFRE